MIELQDGTRRARFEKNCRTLAARQPDMAARIREADASHGTLPPPEDLDAALLAVQGVTRQPTPERMEAPVYLLGAGRGERAAMLLRRHFGPEIRRPVVIIEPDVARIRATFEADDWSDLIESDDRLRFAVGADPIAACRRAFDDDDAFWLHEAIVQAGCPGADGFDAGGSRDPRWMPVIAALQHAFQTIIAEFDARVQAYRAKVTARTPGWPAPTSRRPRVLALSDVSTTAIRHIASDLIDAARRDGCDATLMLEDHREDPFLMHRRARVLTDADPDLLLLFVTSKHRCFGGLAADVPAATYYSSDPERYRLDEAQFNGTDRVFVADPSWMSSFESRGVDAAVLPLATSLNHADTRDDEAHLWRCDVAMVCHLAGPEAVVSVERSTLQQLQALGEALDRSGDGTSSDELIAASPLAHRETPERAFARAVEFAATAHRRRRAAIALVEAGFNVRIHGDARWVEALEGTPAASAYRGPLDYRTEAPAAYRHARVILNVCSLNAPHAINMRALDVPAVGGCLLADDRPGLGEAFDVGREVEAFASIDEAPDLVADLLRDSARRDAVAVAGQARVLRDHTYDARWRRIRAAMSVGVRASA